MSTLNRKLSKYKHDVFNDHAVYLGSYDSPYSNHDVDLYLGFIKKHEDEFNIDGGYLDIDGTIPIGIVVTGELDFMFNVKYLKRDLFTGVDVLPDIEFSEIRSRAVALGILDECWLHYNADHIATREIKLKSWGWTKSDEYGWTKETNNCTMNTAFDIEINLSLISKNKVY